MTLTIPFKQLLTSVDFPIRGVIYVGYGLGAQARNFSDQKVNTVLWLEKEKTRLPELYNATKGYPLQQQYVTETFSNKDIHGKSKRFDTFYKENRASIPLESFDLLVIDLDDKTEIETLEGFLSLLGKYTNIKMIHSKTRGIGDLEKMLSPFGFERSLTSVNDIGWGEVLFVRK